MKKIYLILIFMSFSLVLNAQTYVGGSLGFSINSNTETKFVLSPEAGYRFNKTWAVGTTIDLGTVSYDGDSSTAFSFMPYVRASFAHVSILDFFGELSVGYQHLLDYGNNSLLIDLRPGFIIHLNKHWGILARTSILSFQAGNEECAIGFAIPNGLTVGIEYSF